MRSDEGIARPSAWVVRPGRQLLWAPSWDDSDAALVFDATSGDFWVLSLPAAGLLRSMTDGDTCDTARLSGTESTSNDVELLAELQQHGLIAPLA